MKKHFKKIALSAIFAMAVSIIAPAAQVAEAATTKTFTYAEQKTGDAVTTLVMDKGEKVDLKFNGVSNWKTYTYKWASSNTKVAVVDSAGIVTAVGTGVATIKLSVTGGDGTKYTSTGVTVYVDLNQDVTIGTSSEEEIKSYTMSMGSTATLKANGLKDNVGDRYTAIWTSTDTSVAKIDENGKITPVAPGLTVIQLSVKKVFSGKTMEATPIALLVTAADGSTPVATATPAPTKKPDATATPVPTKVPTATPTLEATPVPSDEYTTYTAVLEADNCLLLKFAKPVDYDISDIALYESISAGSQSVEIKRDILKVTSSNGGTELRVVPSSSFTNGDKYVVKAGSADPGKTVNVIIGEPNRLEVSYECLGEKNKAYAYDEELAIEVPVTLSYRLYYGNIDVTESYKNNGYITYESTTSKYDDYVSISGDVVSFFSPNITVGIAAEYTYYTDDAEDKTLKDTVSISSRKLPNYAVKSIVEWTIVDATKTDRIDWENPVHEVISGNENAKIVAMVADTYGNYYVTDERGVDTANKIYYVADYDSLLARFGYNIEFSAADTDQFIMNEDGTMYPYQAASRANVLVNLIDSGLNSGKYSSKALGVCQMKILAESKLSSITAEQTRVTLAAQAIGGYESRFCETDVEILLKDQYGNEWKGDYALELSSAVSDVNSALDGSSNAPATLNGTTLHINAENIMDATNRTTVSFVITETTTNKKTTVNVTLKKPTLANGEVKVTDWDVEIDKSTVKLGELDKDTLTQSVVVEALKISNGSVQVGLYDDLHVLDNASHKFTISNCNEGEVYVLVLGPDNKPVEEAAGPDAVGVYVDKQSGCVRINITAPTKSGSLALESLEAGKYTVKVTRITGMTSSTPKKATLTASFTVEDNTKTVAYRSVKSTQTSLTVSGENDLDGVKEIIESLFTFSLDGKEWTEMTADMITDVDFTVNGNYIRIKDIDFAVPVEGIDKVTMTYTKNVVVNKTIKTGADD